MYGFVSLSCLWTVRAVFSDAAVHQLLSPFRAAWVDVEAEGGHWSLKTVNVGRVVIRAVRDPFPLSPPDLLLLDLTAPPRKNHTE